MTDSAPMIDAPTSAGAPRARRAIARTAAPGGSPVLFPSCDPRGVLGRALAPDAPTWQTRPDALLFGWMLGLAPGVTAADAARAVLAVSGRDDASLSAHQRSLIEGLRDIASGPPNRDPRRR